MKSNGYPNWKSWCRAFTRTKFVEKDRRHSVSSLCTSTRMNGKKKLEQKADLTAKIEAMQEVECGANEWIDMIQGYAN